MQKKFKRTLASILTFVLLLTSVPFTAFADEMPMDTAEAAEVADIASDDDEAIGVSEVEEAEDGSETGSGEDDPGEASAAAEMLGDGESYVQINQDVVRDVQAYAGTPGSASENLEKSIRIYKTYADADGIWCRTYLTDNPSAAAEDFQFQPGERFGVEVKPYVDGQWVSWEIASFNIYVNGVEVAKKGADAVNPSVRTTASKKKHLDITDAVLFSLYEGDLNEIAGINKKTGESGASNSVQVHVSLEDKSDVTVKLNALGDIFDPSFPPTLTTEKGDTCGENGSVTAKVGEEITMTFRLKDPSPEIYSLSLDAVYANRYDRRWTDSSHSGWWERFVDGEFNVIIDPQNTTIAGIEPNEFGTFKNTDEGNPVRMIRFLIPEDAVAGLVTISGDYNHDQQYSISTEIKKASQGGVNYDIPEKSLVDVDYGYAGSPLMIRAAKDWDEIYNIVSFYNNPLEQGNNGSRILVDPKARPFNEVQDGDEYSDPKYDSYRNKTYWVLDPDMPTGNNNILNEVYLRKQEGTVPVPAPKDWDYDGISTDGVTVWLYTFGEANHVDTGTEYVAYNMETASNTAYGKEGEQVWIEISDLAERSLAKEDISVTAAGGTVLTWNTGLDIDLTTDTKTIGFTMPAGGISKVHIGFKTDNKPYSVFIQSPESCRDTENRPESYPAGYSLKSYNDSSCEDRFIKENFLSGDAVYIGTKVDSSAAGYKPGKVVTGLKFFKYDTTSAEETLMTSETVPQAPAAVKVSASDSGRPAWRFKMPNCNVRVYATFGDGNYQPVLAEEMQGTVTGTSGGFTVYEVEGGTVSVSTAANCHYGDYGCYFKLTPDDDHFIDESKIRVTDIYGGAVEWSKAQDGYGFQFPDSNAIIYGGFKTSVNVSACGETYNEKGEVIHGDVTGGNAGIYVSRNGYQPYNGDYLLTNGDMVYIKAEPDDKNDTPYVRVNGRELTRNADGYYEYVISEEDFDPSLGNNTILVVVTFSPKAKMVINTVTGGSITLYKVNASQGYQECTEDVYLSVGENIWIGVVPEDDTYEITAVKAGETELKEEDKNESGYYRYRVTESDIREDDKKTKYILIDAVIEKKPVYTVELIAENEGDSSYNLFIRDSGTNAYKTAGKSAQFYKDEKVYIGVEPDYAHLFGQMKIGYKNRTGEDLRPAEAEPNKEGYYEYVIDDENIARDCEGTSNLIKITVAFTSKFNIELVNGEGGTAELCYCDATGAYKKYAEQSKVYLAEGEKVWVSAAPAEGYSVKAVKAGPQGKISLVENADGYYEYEASADDQNTGKISITVSYEPISKKKVVLNVYGAKYRLLDGSAAYASGTVVLNSLSGGSLEAGEPVQGQSTEEKVFLSGKTVYTTTGTRILVIPNADRDSVRPSAVIRADGKKIYWFDDERGGYSFEVRSDDEIDGVITLEMVFEWNAETKLKKVDAPYFEVMEKNRAGLESLLSDLDNEIASVSGQLEKEKDSTAKQELNRKLSRLNASRYAVSDRLAKYVSLCAGAQAISAELSKDPVENAEELLEKADALLKTLDKYEEGNDDISSDFTILKNGYYLLSELAAGDKVSAAISLKIKASNAVISAEAALPRITSGTSREKLQDYIDQLKTGITELTTVESGIRTAEAAVEEYFNKQVSGRTERAGVIDGMIGSLEAIRASAVQFDKKAPVIEDTIAKCLASIPGTPSGGGGGGGGSAAAAVTTSTFSKNWFADEAGVWKIRDKAGNVVKNVWLCDDAVAANGQNVWYLLNAEGAMLTSGLVQDNTGNFYSLEMNHNGYYGMLRYKSGTYDGVYIEFSQKHDGTFGAITNQSAIDALKAKYGVTKYAIGNANCVYTKSFE